jgi:hypothetical protein
LLWRGGSKLSWHLFVELPPTAFEEGGGRTGYLVEYGDTKEMFDSPKEEYTK